MTKAWDEMRKAKEDSYFEKKNNEALQRLSTKKKEKPRVSPITGEPMEQVVIHGVVIDRCPKSGGIWLDPGELEQLIEASQAEGGSEKQWSWSNFLSGLSTKEK